MNVNLFMDVLCVHKCVCGCGCVHAFAFQNVTASICT